jgi:hypothetical protein
MPELSNNDRIKQFCPLFRDDLIKCDTQCRFYANAIVDFSPVVVRNCVFDLYAMHLQSIASALSRLATTAEHRRMEGG